MDHQTVTLSTPILSANHKHEADYQGQRLPNQGAGDKLGKGKVCYNIP